MSNKFAKKPKADESATAPGAGTVSPASIARLKRPKLWTNNPDWQNQETGETTEAGEAQRSKSKKPKGEDTVSKKEKAPKAAKVKKEAKAKAPKAEKAGKAPRVSNDDRKITVLAKENPKRAAAATRFDLYKTGMTVAAYIAAGGKRADISWDIKQKFIKVS